MKRLILAVVMMAVAVPATAQRTTESSGEIAPVLVATDFSPDSEAALLWAAETAALLRAPLIVMHAVHDPADAAGFYRRDKEDVGVPMTEVAEKMMIAFLDEARKDHPKLKALKNAVPVVVAGLPSGRIVEVAKREGAQMIVVGSRGLTGLTHVLVGSVAERVAQLAPMPVVIVKHPAEG